MIDIHSHILYGIDDGSKSLEESLTILKKMSELGYKKVIATPHYIENTEYIADNKKKKAIYNDLKDHIKKENIPIELYLGNEIFIDDELVNKMLCQQVYTLNNTNYVLIELPLIEKFEYAIDVIYELIHRGVKVVLAHPERYVPFQKNAKEIEKFTEMGVLLQGNLDSLEGKYGKSAQKLFVKLIKKQKYFVLASDIHHSNSLFFQNFMHIKKKLIHYTNESYVEKILEKNPEFILENKSLETIEV